MLVGAHLCLPRLACAEASMMCSSLRRCLQVVCQDKKVVVAEAKTSCEQLLVAIVQDKRVADEQEKQVRLVSICCLVHNRRQSCALPLWLSRC